MRKPIAIALYLLVGTATGLLVIQQFYVYRQFNRLNPRDQNTNIFREIKVLQENNKNLLDEIARLETKLKEYGSQAQQSNALREDILKNQLILGAVPVSGPGISIIIDRPIDVIWMVDLTNELFAAGAQAIAVNDVRLTNATLGFAYAGKQLTLGGITLSPPFRVTAIGKTDVLQSALEQSGGILKRLEAQYPGISVVLEQSSEIVMPANAD